MPRVQALPRFVVGAVTATSRQTFTCISAGAVWNGPDAQRRKRVQVGRVVLAALIGSGCTLSRGCSPQSLAAVVQDALRASGLAFRLWALRDWAVAGCTALNWATALQPDKLSKIEGTSWRDDTVRGDRQTKGFLAGLEDGGVALNPFTEHGPTTSPEQQRG